VEIEDRPDVILLKRNGERVEEPCENLDKSEGKQGQELPSRRTEVRPQRTTAQGDTADIDKNQILAVSLTVSDAKPTEESRGPGTPIPAPEGQRKPSPTGARRKVGKKVRQTTDVVQVKEEPKPSEWPVPAKEELRRPEPVSSDTNSLSSGSPEGVFESVKTLRKKPPPHLDLPKIVDNLASVRPLRMDNVAPPGVRVKHRHHRHKGRAPSLLDIAKSESSDSFTLGSAELQLDGAGPLSRRDKRG
jgi:hypothetical protein